jgi:PAS domain-containing protein/DNA-binding CsgD family transcriptional regulator
MKGVMPDSAIRPGHIHPARRLAFRIAAAVMLVQAAVFVTAGAAYLLWFEGNLDAGAEASVLAPGRLIQDGQLPHAAISDRAWIQRIVGTGLADALLVGVNGNVFHALDPANLGKQVSSLEGVQASWFRHAGNTPTLTRHVENGRSYLVGITPLPTFDNIAPFLYAYIKLDSTVIDAEKHRMRAATIAAVLFAILVTTIVIYGVFEWLLFRRIRSAVRLLGRENGHDGDHPAAISDEMSLVELGVQKIAAARERERSLRAEAETQLIEVKAKEEASTLVARQAEVQARRAQSLIDAVPDGLITISPDSRILSCNDTAARQLGAGPEAIIGRPVSAFLRPLGMPMTVDGGEEEQWPEVGTHRALCGKANGEKGTEQEIEIVVSRADTPDPHLVVFLRHAMDDEVRHELDLLSQSIGHALRLTPDQWQSVGERLTMLRAYLRNLEAERRIVSEALDAVPLAVTVVDRNGTVRFANRLAERLLDMKDGLLILRGRITASRSKENGQLRERILDVAGNRRTAGHAPWAAMRIERENGAAWFISVAPLGQLAQAPTAEDMAIVMISDPNMPMKPSTTMLRQLHGLTYAEADILGRLTVGMRMGDIADDLGISVETVRTHLKAIFTKTGTSRQADLVRHAVLSGVMLQGSYMDGGSEAGGGPLISTSPSNQESPATRVQAKHPTRKGTAP